MNAYSLDLREKVVAYVQNGHSQREATKVFNLNKSTVGRWMKLVKENKSLKPVPTPRSPHKLSLEKLESYIKEHPDAFLHEIAEALGSKKTTVFCALKKLGYKLKKKQNCTEKERRRREKSIKKKQKI